MPNKIDSIDRLYRKINPRHHRSGQLLADAFDDAYEKQSFYLASLCSPCVVLEKFASFRGVRRACKKQDGEPDPTCAEMYDAGYRIAVTSVEVIRVKLNLEFVSEPDESEYRADGHVNVRQARLKAATLSDPVHSRILTREETLER
jgi:hypothetical protein